MSIRKLALGAAAIAATTFATGAAQAAEEVNVYSYRQPFLVEPLFEAFTKDTGVKVNVLFAETGLTERLVAEGANTPGDVILTVDIGRLNDVKAAGVTAPVESATLNDIIPSQYRDPEGHWFALTTRVRVIYASKERVSDWKSLTYESLAEPRFKGKVCTRSGKHPYTVALIASMIAHHGRDGAAEWLKGLKANLARKPQGNDRGQVQAIYEGVCDVSLGNSYYYGAMLEKEDQKPWAESVNVAFPNQAGRGAHVNISGVALAKHAPHPENAVKLMEWLVGQHAQHIYAETNYEYPVRAGVEWVPLLESLGEYKADDLPISKIAELRKDAVLLVDEVGFDG